MYLIEGSHVEIISGRNAGCWGVVRKIAIENNRQPALLVEYWDGAKGMFCMCIFSLEQLQRRETKPANKAHFEQEVAAQELRLAA